MRKLENDCIVLLNYIAANPGEPQDYATLSEATGISVYLLRRIIYHPWFIKTNEENEYYWALEKYAEKYGFEFEVVHGRCFRHLNVVKIDRKL